MLKTFFKKQMKVFIVAALEWLVEQTDNDLDDKILTMVKNRMKYQSYSGDKPARNAKL